MLRSLRHLRWLFLPLGIIHLLTVYFRNKFYDWQIFRTKRLPKPVISIGNLQMGGTGKTPLTIYILQKLQNEGLNVAVLSRGYKRKSDQEIITLKPDDVRNENLYEAIGDEPALILSNIRSGALGIGADRFRVGEKVLERHAVDLFLLDDGLQHRKLRRDINICLIDVTRWKKHPFLFPFSYLRDCKSSLKRCQAFVLTKIGDERDKAEEIKQKIQRKYDTPVFEGDLQPQGLVNIRDGTEIGLVKLKGRSAAAFCGIANPDHFFKMLKQNDAELVLEKTFPDHHHYSLNDLGSLVKSMKEKGVNAAIATEKDAVKLRGLIRENDLEGIGFLFLRVGFMVEAEAEFFDIIFNSQDPDKIRLG